MRCRPAAADAAGKNDKEKANRMRINPYYRRAYYQRKKQVSLFIGMEGGPGPGGDHSGAIDGCDARGVFIRIS